MQEAAFGETRCILRAVGSIGASELVVMAVIGVVLLAPPVVVLVWLVKKKRAEPRGEHDR